MIVLATPRPAPVSPKSAARSFAGKKSNLIHSPGSTLCWRSRSASDASRREPELRWTRVASCHSPTADARRAGLRRRPAPARHGEELGQRFRQDCPVRSDAWAKRDADQPRACPARPGARARPSDKGSLLEPASRDRAHWLRGRRRSALLNQSPARAHARRRREPVKADPP